MSESKAGAASPAPDLVRWAGLVESTPWLTEGCLRYLLERRQENGLAESGAVVRIGRLIYIDRARWRLWLEQQREGKREEGRTSG